MKYYYDLKYTTTLASLWATEFALMLNKLYLEVKIYKQHFFFCQKKKATYFYARNKNTKQRNPT
jgi:hypothetical protein